MSGKDENMFGRFRKGHLPEGIQREAGRKKRRR